jgi:hypothetical protein
VELCKINPSQYVSIQTTDREKKWSLYFSKDPDGQALFKCITSRIKSSEWATPLNAAKQITAIFRSSSLSHHATPLSITDNREIETTGLSQVTQQYQLIFCIANIFSLKLV